MCGQTLRSGFIFGHTNWEYKVNCLGETIDRQTALMLQCQVLFNGNCLHYHTHTRTHDLQSAIEITIKYKFSYPVGLVYVAAQLNLNPHSVSMISWGLNLCVYVYVCVYMCACGGRIEVLLILIVTCKLYTPFCWARHLEYAHSCCMIFLKTCRSFFKLHTHTHRRAGTVYRVILEPTHTSTKYTST